MSRYTLLVFSSLCSLSLFLFSASPCEAVDNAFSLKIGYQFFQSDEGWEDPQLLGEDSAHFNGRNYALEWDIYPVKFFGIRFGLEYFRQDRAIDYQSSNDPHDPHYYQSYRTLVIVPLTVSAKVRIPTPFVSPYFYTGFGFYFWGIYENTDDSSWFYQDDDDDLRMIQENDGFGFQFGGGLEFHLAPHVFFLLEGEYRALELDYQRYGQDVDIDASTVLLTTGILFR